MFQVRESVGKKQWWAMTPLDGAALALAGRSFLGDVVTPDLAEIPLERLSTGVRELIAAVHEDLAQHPKADINRIIEHANGKGREWRELLAQAITETPALDEARTRLAEALLDSTDDSPVIETNAPLKIAEMFLVAKYQHDGIRTLHFNGGQFWGWDGKC